MSPLEPIAKATTPMVRAFSLRSLNDRKRTVETINIERRNVMPRMGHDHASTLRRASIAWLATISEMRMPAAPGMGSPTMYLPGLLGAPLVLVERTLKRASRTAPQPMNTNATASAASGWWGDVHW